MKIKDYIRDNINIISCCSLVFVLVHAMKFLNYYPCWDSIGNIVVEPQGMMTIGRWFAGISTIFLSSSYDLQWVEGVEAMIFISLSISLIINIFEINNYIYRLVAIGLFVVFPSFTSTFMYGIWTSSYMLSVFLACLSVYTCIKYDSYLSIIVAGLCITFSLGIYQIYFLFSIGIMLLYCCLIIYSNIDWKFFLKSVIVRYVISSSIGVILYFIISKISQIIFEFELSDYQGFSKCGLISIASIKDGIISMLNSLAAFFMGDRGISLYGIINILIIIFIFYLVIRYILLNKDKNKSEKVLIVVLYMITIVLTYAYYLVSSGSLVYHKIMELGNYLVYLFPIIILNRCSSIEKNICEKKGIYLLFILVFYHFINDNIAYHQASISYERTYNVVSHVAMDMDRNNSNDVSKVLFIGGFDSERTDIKTNPIITGASTNILLRDKYHIINFMNYYLNKEYELCSDSEEEDILKKIDIEELGVYPYDNYIVVVDDVMVVALSKN